MYRKPVNYRLLLFIKGIRTLVVGQRLLNSIEPITNQVESICPITIETHMISRELVSASPSTATAYDLEESADRIRSDQAGPPCHRRVCGLLTRVVCMHLTRG